jgi:CHAT domain-containing protein
MGNRAAPLRVRSRQRLLALSALLLVSCSRPRAHSVDAAEILAGLPARNFAGRLFATEVYRPLLGEPAAPDELTGAFPSAAASRPEPTLYRGFDASRLADLADIDLVYGRFATAAAKLSRAANLQPASARIANDAAVACLERGRRLQQPFDLLAGLRHALRAVKLAPRSAATHFNLGLALESFSLRHLALAEWRASLKLDGASGWAGEARHHLVATATDPFWTGWTEWQVALRHRQELNPRQTREVIRTHPVQVYELIVDELLPGTAVEMAAGSPALGSTARLVARLANEMAAQRGDWLLADALQALRRSSLPVRRLIAAHRLLSAGMRAYRVQDFRGAQATLAQAESELRRAGSPLAQEAELYGAICTYYVRADRALPKLQSLLAAVDERRFPDLARRAYWMIGTIAMVRGRHEDALAALRHMQGLARSSDEISAMSDTLLAQNFEVRGEVERGWHHRLRALSILVSRGTARRRHSVLSEAAAALAERHQSDLALVFLEEVLANARIWGEPLGEAEGRCLLARVRADLGDFPGALADAEAALKAAGRMRPGGLRRRTEGAALIARGVARLASRLDLAADDLTLGEALERQTGWLGDRLLVLTSLASVHLARGETTAARNSLIAAVKDYERNRREAAETTARIAIFEHAQNAFDGLMDLALATPGAGFTAAFKWAERARSRYLADSWASDRARLRRRPTIEAREILDLLPPDMTLVEFSVLPDRTLAWVAEDHRLRGYAESPTRTQLDRMASRLEEAMAAPGGDVVPLCAELYDALLRPLQLFERGERRLVIVPDGPLARLPFAALYDRRRQRYVLELATPTLAPSATVLAALLRRHGGPAAQRPRSALIVGAPDLRGTSHADEGELPGAVQEARAIALLYPDSTLLVGGAAARSRFLRELPHYPVVHFAGHALALSDSLDSSLFLLAPDSPGGEGTVSAREVRALSLSRTSLVVLAACRSLAGYSAGREGALSLASSFLAAGVPNVVASFWQVDDTWSPGLMRRFHAGVAAGSPPAAALRAAMLQSLRSDDPQQRAPSAWAAFTALGI